MVLPEDVALAVVAMQQNGGQESRQGDRDADKDNQKEWTRGYLQEIQDFMECAATGRQPLSDLALAFETIKVNYAGYWAAEEWRRVTL